MYFYFCIVQYRSLQKLRDFVEEMRMQPRIGNIIPSFSTEDWDALDKIIKVLELPYITTLRMQRVKYSASDFYGDWRNLKLRLEEFAENPLATDLLDALKEREVGLLNSPIVLASVFFDSRYRPLLTETEIAIAIEHIFKLKRRLEIGNVAESHSSESREEQDKSANDDQYGRLSELISQKMAVNPFYRHNKDGAEFLQCLFGLPVERNMDRSPIGYWAAKKDIFPTIYALQRVVNAAAATQTSVERAFSGFSYILSAHRSNLSHKTLSNILVLRLNADMWKGQKQKRAIHQLS